MVIKLAKIPHPFIDESLASWIHRICQVYDLTFTRFKKIFKTTENTDPDMYLTKQQLHQLLIICDLKTTDTQYIEAIFCKFVERKNLQALLLTHDVDGYSYRYCPICWKNDSIPYMRIEWRFRTSEFCFEHEIDLLSRCSFCAEPIPIHRALLSGSHAPPPLLHLAQCTNCRSDLRLTPNSPDFGMKAKHQMKERIKLQRTIVSAVQHNYFMLDFSPKKYALELLLNSLIGINPPINQTKSDLICYTLDSQEIMRLRKILLPAFRGTIWFIPRHPAHKKLVQKALTLWNQSNCLNNSD
jgi:hypothetical protein